MRVRREQLLTANRTAFIVWLACRREERTPVSRTESPLRDKVIFAVGARRSGTNWLQRILAAHPDCVAVPSESYLFSHGIRPLIDRIHQGSMSSSRTGSVYADREPIIDAIRHVCDVVFIGLMRGLAPDAQRIVERTPEHVLHLDLIGEVYPDAHVVHIIRDGRDVVRSLLNHEWGPSDARQAAMEWRDAIETARAAAPRLSRYREVVYEEMLADPASYVVELLTSLGLSVGATDLEPVLAEAGVGYNLDPMAPAIEAGKWRTSLTPEILAAVEDIAGDLLGRLGYEPSSFTPVRGPRTPSRRPRRPSYIQRAAALRRGSASIVRRAEIGQEVLDKFLHAAAADPQRVIELVSPRVQVRIVDGYTRFEQRGETARRKLIDELMSDRALSGPQRVGFVHPSVPSVMFVGSFEADGMHHPRVFVLTVTDGLIDRIGYYRFPAS